ncbi:unnamed protein product [Microthlaspi erraticum]|uniref:Uncharacterized protein n=1 Tax=Microthlaspi erraticum TaxID=1685480 RepID=A0A6D2L1Q3_9BRAS|nr:unnamed protein product [Microthlaspi erraticum]
MMMITYQRPKAPVAKSAVQVPHSSLAEMRGVYSCDLTVTDRIGEDESGNEPGERNLLLPLRDCDDEEEEAGETLSRGEETALAEYSGRSWRETMYDRGELIPTTETRSLSH